jgi:hypothetical protein
MDDIDPAFNPARKTRKESQGIASHLGRHRTPSDCCVKPFRLFRILKP